MTIFDFAFTIELLRQAIDFAEIECDFIPLRKWENEFEQSRHDLGAMDGRLNLPVGSFSFGDALLQVRCRLNIGDTQALETEFSYQYRSP